MLMLDLFSGLGGASRAMKERGWQVITLDNNPEFKPDICQSIIGWQWDGDSPDLIWASPPCTEFSKASMPKSWVCNRKNPARPNTFLLQEAIRVIEQSHPRFWVIENVRGAIPYFDYWLGPPKKRVGSRILWGEFPPFDTRGGKGNKWKIPPSPDRAAQRSEIPKGISLALCLAIEQVSYAGDMRLN